MLSGSGVVVSSSECFPSESGGEQGVPGVRTGLGLLGALLEGLWG